MHNLNTNIGNINFDRRSEGRTQQPVQLVNFLDEILVAYSYSIHYQPIGSHLCSIEEENNLGHILYILN